MPSLAWETHTTSCKYLGLIFVLGMSVYWERRGYLVTPFTSQSLPHWFKMNFYFQLVMLECFSVNFWVSLVFLKIGWLHFPRFVKCEGVFFFFPQEALSNILCNMDYKSEAFDFLVSIQTGNHTWAESEGFEWPWPGGTRLLRPFWACLHAFCTKECVLGSITKIK